MTESEVRKYCVYLMEQASAKDKIFNDILNELRAFRKESAAREKGFQEIISDLKAQIANNENTIRSIEKEINDLYDHPSVANGDYLSSSISQKGVNRKPTLKGRNKDREQ